MGVFEQFPYANMHEMNLEWLLKKMKELDRIVETFIATESLKFADPIVWDIATQYEKSTIVLDPTGNAYLSLQPVPTGVQLNNNEYWLEIFNFTDYTRTANQNLTVNVETNTTRATAAYAVDDWLIWNDVLYRVTSAIAIDDTLIVAPTAGSNILHFTVEDFIKAFITYATNLINQYKDDIDASEAQYKNDIDASEAAYMAQLSHDIATTTQSLQSQLNLAISGATVDSEVINARLGADGVTYGTLGKAIRTQISDIEYKLADFTDPNNFRWDTLTPTATNTNKFWNLHTAALTDTTGNWFGYEYSVTAGKVYKLQGDYGYSAGGALWMNGTTVVKEDIYHVSANITESYDAILVAPQNATSVRINGYNKLPAACEFYNLEVLSGYTKYDEVNLNFVNDKYIWSTNETPQTAEGFRYAALTNVKVGEKYLIHTARVYDAKAYFIFGNGNMIDYDRGGNVGFFNDVVTIPEGAETLYINGIMPSNNAVQSYTKVFKISNVTLKPYHQSIKWCAIGDSITDAYTLKVGNDYWMPNYVDFVSQILSIEAENKGRSGTGFLNNDGSSYRFAERIATMSSDCNLLTIFGSFNDIMYSDYDLGHKNDDSSQLTVYGQVKKCIETAHSINPECKILIVTPTPWIAINGGAYAPVPNHNDEAIEYCNAIKEVANMYSIPVLDLFNESGLHPWDVSFRTGRYTNNDGTHPLSEVHLKYIAPRYVNKIKELFNI